MKTALYVAAVTRTYRKAIDDFFENEEKYRANMDYYKEEIAACTYRQFTTGFYFRKPDENTQIYDNNTYVNNYIYLGCVEEIENDMIVIHQKNKFTVGEKISFMTFEGKNIDAFVQAIYDEKMNPMESAPHPKQLLYIKTDNEEGIKKGMIIRVKRS